MWYSGYLKTDISVIAKGDFVRTSKTADNEKEDDIETNLLLPGQHKFGKKDAF